MFEPHFIPLDQARLEVVGVNLRGRMVSKNPNRI